MNQRLETKMIYFKHHPEEEFDPNPLNNKMQRLTYQPFSWPTRPRERFKKEHLPNILVLLTIDIFFKNVYKKSSNLFVKIL
ncbi:MAG: hypothetical protein GY739_07445 [Mesoflavibacter sp.]|nr:hypothetical protein [Mesoflavibacter sp.]